jgi:hypothetical protein
MGRYLVPMNLVVSETNCPMNANVVYSYSNYKNFYLKSYPQLHLFDTEMLKTS